MPQTHDRERGFRWGRHCVIVERGLGDVRGRGQTPKCRGETGDRSWRAVGEGTNPREGLRDRPWRQGLGWGTPLLRHRDPTLEKGRRGRGR